MATSAVHLERFEHNGASLIDEVRGLASAPHVVLLHGWGGNRESLRGIGALFEHTHTVHLIDLPGFGEALSPPAEWGTIQYTDLVQQYILERLQGPVILIGHSFGGRISVRLGARHLPAVKGLVLMGVPGLPQPALSRRAFRRWYIRTLRRLLIALTPLVGQKAIDWHTSRYGSRDYLAAGALRSVLVKVVNENLTESAQAIAVPTLLLWGADDGEAPVWMAERYRALLGGRAHLDVLPRKDHFPFTGTGAHLCGLKIRQWLEGVTRA